MAEGLGERIRRIRTQKGLSQADVAASAGLEQTAVSRIEVREDYEPGAFTLYRIASVLGVTVDSLLKGCVTIKPIPTTPKARKGSAVPALVSRLGGEIGAIRQEQAQISDTLAELAAAVKELKAGPKVKR